MAMTISGSGITFPDASQQAVAPSVGVVRIAQTQHFQTGAMNTSTALTPADDTIPQITEGAEFMTVTITPKNAANKLLIEAIAVASPSVANGVLMALHQDAIANALAVTDIYVSTALGVTTLPLRHEMVAGTTSAITFRIRLGQHAAGTLTLNGSGGSRLFGGAAVSSIRVTEYLP